MPEATGVLATQQWRGAGGGRHQEEQERGAGGGQPVPTRVSAGQQVPPSASPPPQVRAHTSWQQGFKGFREPCFESSSLPNPFPRLAGGKAEKGVGSGVSGPIPTLSRWEGGRDRSAGWCRVSPSPHVRPAPAYLGGAGQPLAAGHCGIRGLGVLARLPWPLGLPPGHDAPKEHELRPEEDRGGGPGPAHGGPRLRTSAAAQRGAPGRPGKLMGRRGRHSEPPRGGAAPGHWPPLVHVCARRARRRHGGHHDGQKARATRRDALLSLRVGWRRPPLERTVPSAPAPPPNKPSPPPLQGGGLMEDPSAGALAAGGGDGAGDGAGASTPTDQRLSFWAEQASPRPRRGAGIPQPSHPFPGGRLTWEPLTDSPRPPGAKLLAPHTRCPSGVETLLGAHGLHSPFPSSTSPRLSRTLPASAAHPPGPGSWPQACSWERQAGGSRGADPTGSQPCAGLGDPGCCSSTGLSMASRGGTRCGRWLRLPIFLPVFLGPTLTA